MNQVACDQLQERGRAVAAMMRGETTRVVVDGDCMLPTLEDDWVVELVPRPPRPGDVVGLVTRSGKLTVHRYLGRRPFWHKGAGEWIRLAVTRPDQGSNFDPEVPFEDVVGVAVRVRRSPAEEFVELHPGRWSRLSARLWFVRYWLRRLARGPVRAIGFGPRTRSGKRT